MTSKQRYINADSVGTTLFRRRLTMMCPLGGRYAIIIIDISYSVFFLNFDIFLFCRSSKNCFEPPRLQTYIGIHTSFCPFNVTV